MDLEIKKMIVLIVVTVIVSGTLSAWVGGFACYGVRQLRAHWVDCLRSCLVLSVVVAGLLDLSISSAGWNIALSLWTHLFVGCVCFLCGIAFLRLKYHWDTNNSKRNI